jgi:protein SCO1/2
MAPQNIREKILLMTAIAAMMLPACHKSSAETEALPFYASADFTPHWIDKNSGEIATIPQIAPFVLINQNGDTITERTFAGKIYVADFIFTSCGGICPAMTGNMRKIQEAFKDDGEVLLLSHSVTPELDSVAALKTYAELNGLIGGKWHVVTGARKMIYDLARYSYFADEDLGRPRDENEFLHTENFFLIDQQRRIRGVYNGVMPAEIERLIEDISALKKEAAT